MKKIFVILTLVFMTAVCNAQTEETDSLNCDSVVRTFLGGMTLDQIQKNGANAKIKYLYNRDETCAMMITLNKEGVEVNCFDCKRRNYMVFFYVGGHYWVYYIKGSEKSLEKTIDEFISIRNHFKE